MEKFVDISQRQNTMTSLEIAEVTGREHKNVLRDIRNLLEQGVCALNFELSSYKQELPNGGTKDVPMYSLTKKGCIILASGYDALLREKIINRWEELETGKAIPYYISKTEEDARVRMIMVEGMKRVLNLNDASTLSYAKKLFDPLGLPTPDYVPSKGILKSASELLKERNAGISAQAFNKLAIKEGYLEEKVRKSSSGKNKSFKSVTLDKGAYFGENQVCPNNPKETQPSWYEDKFDQLLSNLLGE